MKYKGVFFDFDYTLGDATDAIMAGFTHGFVTLGRTAPEREAVRQTVGLTLEDGYTLLTGDPSPENRLRFRDLFSEVARPMQQLQGVPLFPGADALLRALAGAGISTALVSTKYTPSLQTIMERHQLDQVFALMMGGDLVKSPKPDPEGLNATMAQLGLTPDRVLFCGDTVIDAETARRAGTDFAAVLNGTTPGEAFAPFPCVHIAPDLIELRTWLGV